MHRSVRIRAKTSYLMILCILFVSDQVLLFHRNIVVLISRGVAFTQSTVHRI